MARVQVAGAIPAAVLWATDGAAASGGGLRLKVPAAGQLAVIDTTVYAAATGGSTIAPAAFVTNSDGELPGYVDEGTYTLTVGAKSFKVEAVTGSGVWLKSELPPYVLPRGTAGNATTQTTEITTALAASSEVFLPPGTFPTTGLTGASLKRLRGVGAGTIIKLANATAAPVIDGSSLDQFELADLVIDGNKAGQTTGGDAINLTGCTRSSLHRVEVKNATLLGVHFVGGSDLAIEGCLLRDNGAANTSDGSHTAILAQSGVTHLRVRGNTINDTSDCAILVTSCYDAVLCENVIDTCFFIGIGLGAGDGNNITIADNVIRSSAGNGIDTGTATSVTVTGNAITDCFDGIDADMSILTATTTADLTITGNKVKDAANWGIVVAGATAGGASGSHGVTIANNVVDTAQLQGIDVASIRDATISGNVVRNASRQGVGFGGIELNGATVSCTGIMVVGNRIYEDVLPKQCYGIHKGTGNDYNIYANNSTRGCLASPAGVAGANDIDINNIV